MQVENSPPYSANVKCPSLGSLEGGYRTTKARVDMLLKKQADGTLVNTHQNYIDTWVALEAHQKERLRRLLDEDWSREPIEFGLQNCFDAPPPTLKRKNKNIFDCGCQPEFNPVCGLDGKSYSSTCMATCNGTDILKNETCTIKGPVYILEQGGSYSAPFFMTEAEQEALGGGNVGLQSITEEEYQASVQNALTAYTAKGQGQAKSSFPTTSNSLRVNSIPSDDVQMIEKSSETQSGLGGTRLPLPQKGHSALSAPVFQRQLQNPFSETELTQEEGIGFRNTAIILLAIGVAVFVAMRVK